MRTTVVPCSLGAGGAVSEDHRGGKEVMLYLHSSSELLKYMKILILYLAAPLTLPCQPAGFMRSGSCVRPSCKASRNALVAALCPCGPVCMCSRLNVQGHLHLVRSSDEDVVTGGQLTMLIFTRVALFKPCSANTNEPNSSNVKKGFIFSL